ncbi:MAG: hypothetical protein ACRDF9_06635 [Candidatus Limnocylindria bacterium]
MWRSEAVAFAFAATALLTFTYGLLENIAFPRISLTWILPLMIVLWTLGKRSRVVARVTK